AANPVLFRGSRALQPHRGRAWDPLKCARTSQNALRARPFAQATGKTENRNSEFPRDFGTRTCASTGRIERAYSRCERTKIEQDARYLLADTNISISYLFVIWA